jgi:hypothetical protein
MLPGCRHSVASGCAHVPVISSRTEITEAPSFAASLAKTVDFPISGSPSRTTNGIARKSLTRSIERSSFPSPSVTLTRRSISASAEFGMFETHDSGHFPRSYHSCASIRRNERGLHHNVLKSSGTSPNLLITLASPKSLGLRDDPSSARPHDRAGWWDCVAPHGGGCSTDCLASRRVSIGVRDDQAATDSALDIHQHRFRASYPSIGGCGGVKCSAVFSAANDPDLTFCDTAALRLGAPRETNAALTRPASFLQTAPSVRMTTSD